MSVLSYRLSIPIIKVFRGLPNPPILRRIVMNGVFYENFGNGSLSRGFMWRFSIARFKYDDTAKLDFKNNSIPAFYRLIWFY